MKDKTQVQPKRFTGVSKREGPQISTPQEHTHQYLHVFTHLEELQALPFRDLWEFRDRSMINYIIGH